MTKAPIQPTWFQQAPPRHSYRAIFKWGAPGRFHHPKSGLIRLLQQQLDWTPEQLDTAPHRRGTLAGGPSPAAWHPSRSSV